MSIQPIDEDRKLLAEGFSLLRSAAFYNIIIFVLGTIISIMIIISTVVFLSSLKPADPNNPFQNNLVINPSVLMSFMLIIVISGLMLLIFSIISIFFKLIPSVDRFYKWSTDFSTVRTLMKTGYYGGFILSFITFITFIITIAQITLINVTGPVLASEFVKSLLVLIPLILITGIFYLISQIGLIMYFFRLHSAFHSQTFNTVAIICLISLALNFFGIIPLLGSIFILMASVLILVMWILVYEESSKQIDNIQKGTFRHPEQPPPPI